MRHSTQAFSKQYVMMESGGVDCNETAGQTGTNIARNETSMKIFFIIVSIAAIFGTISNGITIYFFGFNRQAVKRKLNIPIIAMACVDLFSCAVIMPSSVVMLVRKCSMPRMIHYAINFISSWLVIYTLLVVNTATYERFSVVCRPHRYRFTKRRIKVVYVFHMLLSLVMTLLATFPWSTIDKNNRSVLRMIYARPILYIATLAVTLTLYSLIFKNISRRNIVASLGITDRVNAQTNKNHLQQSVLNTVAQSVTEGKSHCGRGEVKVVRIPGSEEISRRIDTVTVFKTQTEASPQLHHSSDIHEGSKSTGERAQAKSKGPLPSTSRHSFYLKAHDVMNINKSIEQFENSARCDRGGTSSMSHEPQPSGSSIQANPAASNSIVKKLQNTQMSSVNVDRALKKYSVEDKRMILVFFIITLVFLISWLPEVVFDITKKSSGWRLLIYMNNFMNPIVYFVLNKRFRIVIKGWFRC